MRGRIAAAFVVVAVLLGCLAKAAGADSGSLARLVAARTAYEQKRWAEAIPPLVALTVQSPDNGAFHVMLARARFETGDHSGAEIEYHKARALGAADPADVAFRIAKCSILQGKTAAALNW